MVYNRLPFLSENADTDAIIAIFKAEVYYELQGVLTKSDVQLEDDAAYSGKERSLIADVVAIQMLSRRALENMEGLTGSAAGGNKVLTKAKAGSTEAEFEIAKASDGAKTLLKTTDMIMKLVADANRKAMAYGFIFDYNAAGELAINALSSGGSFTAFNYCD